MRNVLSWITRSVPAVLLVVQLSGCTGATIDNGTTTEATAETSAELFAIDCAGALDGCYKGCQGETPSPTEECFEDCTTCFDSCLSTGKESSLCSPGLPVP